MPRAKTADSDLAAIRSDIAALTQSLIRLQAELSETRSVSGAHNGNGNGTAGQASNGHHHGVEELLAGAVRMGSGAADTAGEAIHAGGAWIDDLLRKNPRPAVLTALGVGFVLGVMGRR